MLAYFYIVQQGLEPVVKALGLISNDEVFISVSVVLYNATGEDSH